MAQSLSHKVVASPENSPRVYYEASLDGCTCFKISGGLLRPYGKKALCDLRLGHLSIPYTPDRLVPYHSALASRVRAATISDLPRVEK
jgi:hypothetical protein